MLIQFMVKNVLSFKEETILDMTAINAYKEHSCNLIKKDKENYVRVAAIYGANASGKSNIYKAMYYFKDIIMKSLNNVDDTSKSALYKYYVPFSFQKNKSNSEYQIIVSDDEFEYKYGFEYNKFYVVTEWLYKKSLKTNRTSIIFERTTKKVDLGASVRKECDVYKEQIPSDALALSFFNKLKLKNNVFRAVYNEIMSVLVMPTNFCEDHKILEKFLPSVIKKDKKGLLKFLSAIDTGINDIVCDDTDKQIRFYTYHIGKDKDSYPLELYSESDGTIKSIMLYIYAKRAISDNKILFVDELNIKLHPLLLKFIIDLFYDESSKAQLIYTTHDTTLMDKKFFRRDQIWFVQKDDLGYSKLIALSDFKVRSDASFEKDYLAGVYGGIPLLKEFEL